MTDPGRSATRERFLLQASGLLAETPDEETALLGIARLAVAGVADWCAFDLMDGYGGLRTVAVAHAGAEPVVGSDPRAVRPSLDVGDESGPAAVLRTGAEVFRPSLVGETDDAAPTSSTVDRASARPTALLCVPLRLRARLLGVLTLAMAESGRTFTRADLRLARRLADRTATVLEHARLYREVSQFKATLDATLDCIFMLEASTLRVTYGNHGAAVRLGYDESELLGRHVAELIPQLDEARLRALPASADGVEARGLTVETRLRARDGRLLPAEVLFQHVVLEPGRGGRLVAIARDATERLQVQERLRGLARRERARAAELEAMLASFGDAVVVCEPDGTVSLANPMARRLFGDRLASWQDLQRQMPAIDLPPPDLDQAQTDAAPLASPLRIEGQERWVELHVYRVLGPGEGTSAGDGPETLIASIYVVHDATQARRALRAREAFIGILSHELRTPVTTIYAGAKRLRRASRMARTERVALYGDIEAEAERLYRLVEDLLVLARSEGGSLEDGLADEPVLLQRVLPVVVEAQRRRHPGRRLELDLPIDLPPVGADPTYLEQVTRNLVDNAVKYSPPAAPVEVRVEPVGDEVRVLVRDHGPGFTPQEAERLFELYYRAPSTAGAASGSGIGLFVCQRLVEAMHGRIWAARAPGGGAEFGFALRTVTEDA